MALGDPYATLEQLKGRLDIEDAVDDDDLAAALAAVSRGIEKFCHRQFNKAETATARLFTPTWAAMVRVDDFHTTTGLVIATDPGGDATFGTTLEISQYELHPLNGIVDGEEGWPYSTIRGVLRSTFPCTGRASLRVTAQWGWAAVPAPVRQACLILAAECFKLKDAPFGVAGFGEYGVVRIRQNPIASGMLAPYRRDPVLVG
ncbi:hypothetical protein [Streptosporangium sp. NPDC048865]|uniref:hypothetical protein n=1 Tax=Streptosporangium sp. NPDC048865 TaxID=3155766 RepID=UPI0034240C43